MAKEFKYDTYYFNKQNGSVLHRALGYSKHCNGV